MYETFYVTIRPVRRQYEAATYSSSYKGTRGRLSLIKHRAWCDAVKSGDVPYDKKASFKIDCFPIQPI
jgi:hypothetical protein